ncbi:hypothetical protein A33Q_3308 [Indibacter alkaliphilus LW1]|uniref:Uncharacterized protein n=1 Tax=Indibacter alkaliphilus (strain CCUG 57479 / KCTC 22604 / LW1) TaxID=1189612 RepID=S2E007_INDAL|nr:hypothetical protein A33Q_3308 [Indibacter alkaliphilus LW1]
MNWGGVRNRISFGFLEKISPEILKEILFLFKIRINIQWQG